MKKIIESQLLTFTLSQQEIITLFNQYLFNYKNFKAEIFYHHPTYRKYHI